MSTRQQAFERHYEQAVAVRAFPEDIFERADDHAWLAGHMASSSWMMGGGTMTMCVDDQHGRAIGSHITMTGRVFGISLFLDEIVTERVPPWKKAWETVGTPRLLVIGAYRMGFQTLRDDGSSRVTVFIDYDLPLTQRWLGLLFGDMYARWCVTQMVNGIARQFGGMEGART